MYPIGPNRGEGIQQALQHKLDAGVYELDFDYLSPCDSNEYAVALYFGTNKNVLTYHVATVPLNRTPVGIWQNKKIQFTIPAIFHREFKWFILLNEGDKDTVISYQISQGGSYLYLDDLHLTPSACSTCEPTQQISWNENVPNFFSPDGDGMADTLTIENVNNVNSYRIDVYDRWGGRVWFKQGFDLDGFENLMIRWDGTRRPGGQALASDTYYMTMQLDNCNSRVTRQYTIALCRNASCNLGAHVQVPNYVPPLFGLVVPPTWYQNLDVYGGPYYGQHHWYACHRITVGDAGSQITPYFWAANGSELKFSATFDIDIPTGHRVDFDTLADVEFIIESVACCPSLRQAAPDSMPASDSLPAEPVLDKRGDGLAELLEAPCPNSPSLPARLHVYPNPSQGDWQLDYQLGTAREGLLRLYNAEGRLLGKWRLKDPAGQFRSDLPGLAKGLYVLRLDAGATRLSTRLVVE